MKLFIGMGLLVFSSFFIFCARADPHYSKSNHFQSISEFTQTAQDLKPSKESSFWASLFSITELGQPDDPKTGEIVMAEHIMSVQSLWSNDRFAVMFITALPPTEISRSDIGVVILLVRTADQWNIADFLRYTARGHTPHIECNLTSFAGTGYQLGSEGCPVILTVQVSQGGRGYGYSESESLEIEGNCFKKRIP